jgi:hypothetical protein
MEQRKGDVWTLELEKMSGLFCHHDFFRDEDMGHVIETSLFTNRA